MCKDTLRRRGFSIRGKPETSPLGLPVHHSKGFEMQPHSKAGVPQISMEDINR